MWGPQPGCRGSGSEGPLQPPRWLRGKEAACQGRRRKSQSLGGDDPLEEHVAGRSSTLAWEVSWTEEPGGLQSRGHKESDTTEPRAPPPPKSPVVFPRLPQQTDKLDDLKPWKLSEFRRVESNLKASAGPHAAGGAGRASSLPLPASCVCSTPWLQAAWLQPLSPSPPHLPSSVSSPSVFSLKRWSLRW